MYLLQSANESFAHPQYKTKRRGMIVQQGYDTKHPIFEIYIINTVDRTQYWQRKTQQKKKKKKN